MSHVAIASMTPLDVGGIARHVLQIVDHLGHEFDLSITAPLGPPFTDQIEDRDTDVDLTDIDPAPKHDVTAVGRFRSHFAELAPDLVHTHDARSRLFAHPAAAMLGLPTIHTAHTPPMAHDHAGIKKAFYRGVQHVFNRTLTDRIIFVSRNVEHAHIQRGIVPPDRSTTIHNGLELDRFRTLREDRSHLGSRLRERIGVEEDVVLLGTVSRLDPEKAVDTVVRAAARLDDGGQLVDRMHFVVVGDGSERSTIEQTVDEHGLGEAFTFLGHVDQTTAHATLAGLDVYLLPSDFESLSYSALEAIALGVPGILSDVGGNSEIVRDGMNGFLVSPRSPAQLAGAIDELASDPELREAFGRASRRRAQAFTADGMAQTLAQEYRRLTGRARPNGTEMQGGVEP